MNLHPLSTNWAPSLGFVLDADAYLKAQQEASEYEYQKISPGFFLCKHGDNAYVIGDAGKTVGCSCPAMTFRKTHADGCKHISAFLRVQEPPDPISPETETLLRDAGWTGDPLHPPAAEPKKKKKPSAHNPAREPEKQATTRAQQHKQYESMTPEQIIAGMSDAELRRNAKKGAPMAIDELERREANA